MKDMTEIIKKKTRKPRKKKVGRKA